MSPKEKAYYNILKKLKAKKKVPLISVIRQKCLDCMGFSEAEVRRCESDDCVLWNFRMGKSNQKKNFAPNRKEILAKARAARKINLKK
jgi:hypothetical protein